MKITKLLSVFLAISMLACMFVACDMGGSLSDEDAPDLPDRDFYDITVSFQIKNAAGETYLNAENYNYKSHAEPTILNIVDHYLAVVAEYTCKIDDQGTLIQIGGMKADKNKGDFWGFVNGKINLSKAEVMNNLSEGKMGNTLVEDGGKFTIMLISGEEE